MAKVRFWAIVNEPNLSAAQSALASMGEEWEGSPNTPYAEPPDFTTVKVICDGFQCEEALAVQAESLLASVTGARTWRGPVYGLESDDSEGILQMAEALEADPVPGPLVKVSRNAALALGYKVFGHGELPVESLAPSS